MPLSILNIFLGFAGFLLAFYIAQKKRRKVEHFVCPLRGNCHDVIYSDYSMVFGIHIEYLGMMYYGIVALFYGWYSLMPTMAEPAIPFLFLLSSFAVVFSLYLTFLQIFTLKKLCTWCLISAGLTVIIFILTCLSFFDILFQFFIEWKQVMFIAHVFGVAIGLGAATLADFFFFKFISDFRISEVEASILRTFSQVIWVAIGLIVMSGLAIFLPDYGTLWAMDVFRIKGLVAIVLLANSSVLNLYVAPRFLQIQFGKHDHVPGELTRVRTAVFALGPISIVSWYFLFVLVMLETLPASFDLLWRVYAALLLLAIVIGLSIGRVIDYRARKVETQV